MAIAFIILAAGKGSRMKSDLPKVMHEVARRPMVNWVIAAAQSLKPKKIIVVAGPEMPDLEAASKPHKTVIQKDRNGTGGAVNEVLGHGSLLTLCANRLFAQTQAFCHSVSVFK